MNLLRGEIGGDGAPSFRGAGGISLPLQRRRRRRQGHAGRARHPARASEAVRPGLSGRDRRRRADRLGNPDHRPHAGRRGDRREFPRAACIRAGRDGAARRRARPHPSFQRRNRTAARTAEPGRLRPNERGNTKGGNDDEIHQTRCDPHDRRRRRRRRRQPVPRLARLRPGRADIHARGRRDAAAAALVALRAGRRGCVARQHQALHRRHRRRRCASTRKAGRTSARRPRSPPMSAPAPT